MSVDFAATVLGGLLFFGFMFAIYLYIEGKKLKIVDREDN